MIIECSFISLGQTYLYRVPLQFTRFHEANEWFEQQGSSGTCDSFELTPRMSEYCAFFKNYEEAFAFVLRFG